MSGYHITTHNVMDAAVMSSPTKPKTRQPTGRSPCPAKRALKHYFSRLWSNSLASIQWVRTFTSTLWSAPVPYIYTMTGHRRQSGDICIVSNIISRLLRELMTSNRHGGWMRRLLSKVRLLLARAVNAEVVTERKTSG